MSDERIALLRELEVLTEVCAAVRYIPTYTEGTPAKGVLGKSNYRSEVPPKIKGTIAANLLTFDEITSVKVRIKQLMRDLGVEFADEKVKLSEEEEVK
jgi:hypothetical protein